MSWPYLHTLINHFPIILTVIGALAVLAATMIERRAIWIYALSTLVLAGLTAYPAWVTGDRAADAVRKAWYIAPGAIHSHSAAADITVWIVGVTGLLALIALITMSRVRDALSPPKGFRILVDLAALVSICAVGYTGYLGGKIVVESPILALPTPPVISPPAPTGLPSPSTQPPTVPGATPSPVQQQPLAPQAGQPQAGQPQAGQPQSQPVQPQPRPADSTSQTSVPKPQIP